MKLTSTIPSFLVFSCLAQGGELDLPADLVETKLTPCYFGWLT